MRIAVIGSGAREHAISWGFSREGHEVWTLPGNGGCRRSVPIKSDQFDQIDKFCRANRVDLIVVGPEKPLALGIQDELAKHGHRVFGPSKRASVLESSKIWAKEFMIRNGIQTPPFWIAKDMRNAKEWASQLNGDCVLKWDGLAAGKGVAVCSGRSEAEEFVGKYSRQFGSEHFVIEKKLEGRELSLFALTDGREFVLLPAVQDYKRVYDGDQGPNTGGMGAVSCEQLLDAPMKEKILRKIVRPTIRGLQKEAIDYMGFLFFGLMLTDGEPYLLEYNVRLGDPEASLVVPMLKTPLAELITACLEHRLGTQSVKWHEEPFVNIVLVSGGYPGEYRTGFPIAGLEVSEKDLVIFHAGTEKRDLDVVTKGGRVLNVVASGPSLEAARRKAYQQCRRIQFSEMYYRKDIGVLTTGGGH
ncbi:MAG: phosphoribosylamine--glycine ligase [Deltaproteobacteria bacterium]|nr:phosphoribosylamine--glycine ligase [Deltaproteobacteria bacterium]